MKRLIILILIFAAVAGGFWAYKRGQSPLGLPVRQAGTVPAAKAIYYCPMHPTYTSDRPGNCPICNMKLVLRGRSSEGQTSTEKAIGLSPQGPSPNMPLREVTVKELMSMKPGEICLLHKCKMGQCMFAMTEEFARLGKCPHCGEDLGVIVKDLAPNGYASVKLNPEKQQMIGVKTDVVKKMPMTKTIRAVGRIAYDPDLYQTQEEFVQAVQAQKKAEAGTIDEIKEQAARLVESARLKLKLKGLNDELIKEIEEAARPDRSLLYSETGGKVWLYASIYEYEIPLVKVGEKVEAEVPSHPEKKFEGTIRAIDSVLDPTTRSVRIRAVLDNAEGFLKPEMYVNAYLRINLGLVLTVPTEAVFKTGEASIVFVEKPDGTFEPREITLGSESEGYYEGKSGVSEGEMVVTSGNFLIDSESRLKAALQGMGSAGGHQHGG